MPVDYAATTLGRFDPALIAQARKRVSTAKETWSALSGGDIETLRRIRLTPADAERLGHPLFDTAAADALVGPLYPLYREPEAHHVAYRLAARAAATGA